ncbi:MAG TPA: cyclic nucleotide-binding domain-containing protein [Gammaproteobacteria bacterium]|nr:MAG: hypothetical protein A3E83_06845 [Gammaproteobacteria bacterium RIFCSPHIGHO2_12_FULL_41_20]HLB43522.1 cyclic nucleotide-binding domain-containing protein [Gammaproteobacteria bacterium]
MDTVDPKYKQAFIKKQACFSQLTDQEISELATLFVEKSIQPGETIVTQGDLVDSVFLIVDGTADVRYVSIKDNTIHTESVAQLGPEQAIGLSETGFYSLSGLRTATVVALTKMILLRLSVAAFHGFALSHSHVNAVMRKFSSNIT